MDEMNCEVEGCAKVIGVGDFIIGCHPFCKEHKDNR